MNKNTLKPIAKLFAGIAMLSGNPVFAATYYGSVSYTGWENGPHFEQIFPAYEGENSVYYDNQSEVSLTRDEIDIVVGYFDHAISLYRQYGQLPSYPQQLMDPQPAKVPHEFLEKGSVIVRPHPEGTGAGGLGGNGKAEIFKFAGSEIYFDRYPTDVRTWNVAFYELGRAVTFNIDDYFRFGHGGSGIHEGFPRFVAYSVFKDYGVGRYPGVDDTPWEWDRGVYPGLMEDRLTKLLEYNEFPDFYINYDKPDTKGDPILAFNIYGDTNQDGEIQASDENEYISLNDAQAVIFFALKEHYGDEFITRFFEYAGSHSIIEAPKNGLSALCNIVKAGNSAITQTHPELADIDPVNRFLATRFGFPNCVFDQVQVESFEVDSGWLNKGEFEWTSHSGKTQSWQTGPLGANDGSYYLYLETSSGNANSAGDLAIFESPIFPSGDLTLRFDYHMYGMNIGTLAVDVYKDQRWQEVWSKSGALQQSESDSWRTEAISITSVEGSAKVRFRAVAAGGYRGDIAIDNIQVTSKDEPRKFRIENRNKPEIDLNIEGISEWYIREVPGTGMVNICDAPTSNNCLNVENGYLALSQIASGWWSAQWQFQSTWGGYYRINNKWKSDHYLHNETGSIVAGNAESFWFSAQWKIESD